VAAGAGSALLSDAEMWPVAGRAWWLDAPTQVAAAGSLPVGASMGPSATSTRARDRPSSAVGADAYRELHQARQAARMLGEPAEGAVRGAQGGGSGRLSAGQLLPLCARCP
jgi:hypothetical protein